MLRRIAFVAAVAAVPLFNSARADTLGVAGDFNVFVLHDMTQYNSDIQGKLAVGNNLSLSNFSVSSVIVGGNFSQSGGYIPGNVTVGGNATLNNGAGGGGHYQINGNLSTNNPGYVSGGATYGGSFTGPSWFPHTKGSYTALPLSFDDAASYLTSSSSFWGALASNGASTSSAGHLTLTGTDSSLNVFSLDASQLLSGISFDLSVPSGSTALINILGTSVSLANFGLNLSGIDAEHLLFNLPNATTVNLSGIGLKGSFLAPNASVNFNNANIDGTLIAYNLAGNGESHLHLFQGNLPGQSSPNSPSSLSASVPLPSAAAAGIALLSLLALRKLRSV